MGNILEFSHSELNRLTKGELVQVVLELKEKIQESKDRIISTKEAAQILKRSEAGKNLVISLQKGKTRCFSQLFAML